MSKKDQAPAPEQTGNGAVYSDPITLQTPIQRGDTVIETIRLRQPRAGELRGLKMFNVLQMDVNTIITLVPRISEPTIMEDDVEDMHPRDITNISQELADFLAG